MTAEDVIDRGEVVFEHADNGFVLPGSPPRCIYRWQGQFVVRHPDLGDLGPFDTLHAALQADDADLLRVTSGSGSVVCPLLPTADLIALLECDEDEVELEINGEAWTFRDGEWQREE
ncbi:MAG: hypothetical protein MUF18_19415 [Fimbriiglobus sp.]|jgi:hypothetical protein|nr:hypothetical protein [Fimbriiglobus sp.]